MKHQRLLLTAALILIVMLFAGCAKTNQPAPTVPAPQTTTNSDSQHTINITGFAFSPASLDINKGDTVTWVNQDSAPHTATGTAFDSKTLNQGQSYSFTFTQSGTFNYKCTFHPSMLGVIIVK